MTDYTACSDEALVRFCNEKDEAAWNALCRRFIGDATFLSSQFKNSPVETEDLVSEGLIGLFSAVKTYAESSGASFRTYANACMKNRMRNAVRNTGAQKQIPFFQCVPLEEQLDAPDGALSPEDRMIAKTEAEKIERLIATALTEKEREVFTLFSLGGSYSEISRKTGLTVKAVDGTLQRARKKLRAQLS